MLTFGQNATSNVYILHSSSQFGGAMKYCFTLLHVALAILLAPTLYAWGQIETDNHTAWPQTMEGWKTLSPQDIQERIDDGVDVNARGFASIQWGHVEIGGENNWTALHYCASFNEDPEVIMALLNAGADVNAKGKDNVTPIINATFNNNPDIIIVLIEAGADADAIDDEYGTALHIAVMFNDNLAITTALIEAGVDVNVQNSDSWTALHLASENDNPAIITALLGAGAHINARTKQGETPLHWAINNLHWTINNKNLAIASTLIDAGAEVNIADESGGTPLHKAVNSENIELIALLLDAGADVHARNNNMDSPWDYAQMNDALKGTDVYLRMEDMYNDRL